MSNPMAPAQSRKPKQYAGDRIQNAGEAPMRNPGSDRVIAAKKLGIEPRNLTTAPGLPQRASSAPRPQAPPVQAPRVPNPTPEKPATGGVALPERLAPFPDGKVPMPAPRPTGAMVNDITPQGGPPPPGEAKVTMGWGGPPVASPDAPVPPVQPETLTTMISKVLRDRLGMPSPGNTANAAPAMKAPAPPPNVWGSVPIPGQTLPQVVAQANQAKDGQRMQSTQNEPVPMPRPRPDGANAVQLPMSAPSPPGKPPATVEVVASPPADAAATGRFTPSKETYRGFYERPAPEEKTRKQGPQKPTKEKGANFYYYDTLGVTRGDNRAASNALTKLQQRAIDDPKTITPAEDRLLASSGKVEAFNSSMEPADVVARFAKYKEGKSAADTGPERFQDRAPGGDQRGVLQVPGQAPKLIAPQASPKTSAAQKEAVAPPATAEELAQQAIDEADKEDD